MIGFKGFVGRRETQQNTTRLTSSYELSIKSTTAYVSRVDDAVEFREIDSRRHSCRHTQDH